MSEPSLVPWPDGFLERLIETEKELALAARALTLAELAARFERANPDELYEALRSLVALQRVREQGDRYLWSD